MPTFAVLPIKRFDRAKQRLDPPLSPAVRRELAGAMVADVLAALAGVGGLDAIVAVTGEPVAAELARAAGAETIDERREDGQSAAAVAGIARACERGAHNVLLVPGDCPALDGAELEALLAGAAPGPSVAIVPDRHGTGTNALLLAPPNAIVPAFGPGSFDRHVAAARKAGASAHVERLPSLALDVDTAGDLAALRTALESLPGAAPRTRRVLAGALAPGA